MKSHTWLEQTTLHNLSLTPKILNQYAKDKTPKLKKQQLHKARAQMKQLLIEPNVTTLLQLLKILQPRVDWIPSKTPPTFTPSETPQAIFNHKLTPNFLALIETNSQNLDQKDQAYQWKSSPMNRLRKLLEPQHRAFAIILNKTHLRFVQLHPSSLLSYIQWPIPSLISHPNCLHALAWLLSLAVHKQKTLKELFAKAQSIQTPLTETLRNQVKESFKSLFQSFIQDFDHSPVQKFQSYALNINNQALQEILLVVLMRVIVLLYAEQKNLLPINDPIYQSSYSLQAILQSLDNPPNEHYPDYSSDAWLQFLANSRLLHKGCHHPSLNLIPYGSQLFDPDRFPILEQWKLRNRDLHRVLTTLTRGPKNEILSFNSLDVEQMGFLYEGLLELEIQGPPTQRKLAPSPLRKDSGTYYTPRSLTIPLVEHTLSPLVHNEDGSIKSPREILNLKVCDLTAGSGAFLVQMTRFLATALHDSWLEQASKLSNASIPTIPYAEPMLEPRLESPLPLNDHKELLILAQRLIVERCIYGVDLNPLAIQIAQLSLWILSLSKHRPFTFLNHSLKTGNSLLGVKLPQLQSWNLKTNKKPLPILTQIAKEKVALALSKRQQLARLTVVSPEDRAFKEQALQQADKATKNLITAADLLLGTTLHNPKQLTDTCSQFLNANSDESWKAIKERAQNNLRSQQSFHWSLEFPEIFNSKRQGFDAILANPPFQGGQKLSSTLGSPVRKFLVQQIADGKRGSADLSAYFLRRAFSLLRKNGKLGIIVTNSVTEGNSRKVALEPILEQGATIYRAQTSTPWPGAATLNITTLHINKGPWTQPKFLNGAPSQNISPNLDSIDIPTPKSLPQQKDIAFQGTIPVGNGFIISPKQATQWLLKDPKYSKVLHPYLTGKDFNNNPSLTPTRWIIHFQQWPLEKAKQFPLALEHLEEHVKPFRQQSKHQGQKENWWHHGAPRKTLYQTIKNQDKVLARSRISNHHILAFLPAQWIYADGLVIFATEENHDFAVLQSNIHETWARRFSSTLRSDMRYSLTTAFETFPMPILNKKTRQSLSKLIERLEKQRWQITAKTGNGLNKTYAALHNPKERSSMINKLRAIHRQIDQATLEAYSWNDLISDDIHQFADHGNRRRLTLIPEIQSEIMARLSALNAKEDQRESRQSS